MPSRARLKLAGVPLSSAGPNGTQPKYRLFSLPRAGASPPPSVWKHPDAYAEGPLLPLSHCRRGPPLRRPGIHPHPPEDRSVHPPPTATHKKASCAACRRRRRAALSELCLIPLPLSGLTEPVIKGGSHHVGSIITTPIGSASSFFDMPGNAPENAWERLFLEMPGLWAVAAPACPKRPPVLAFGEGIAGVVPAFVPEGGRVASIHHAKRLSLTVRESSCPLESS